MASDIFYFIYDLVTPPFSFLLLGVIGIVLAGRYPRLGRTLAGLSLALLWIVSSAAFNRPFLNMLSWEKPVDMGAGNGAQAIVVLGGGITEASPEYGGTDTVKVGTLTRLRYAAWLHRQTALPILVTGGVVGRDDVAEGELMKSVLEKEFSTPVEWAETKSKTTFENARNSAPLLRKAGVTKVYLVTTATHMRRAMQAFAPTGIEVVPAAIEISTQQPFEVGDFLPSEWGFRTSLFVCHELVGRAWYAVRQLFE